MLDTLLGNPLFMLFLVIGVGLALGRVQVFGLSLGSSGVLFSGLVAGHFGYHVYRDVGTLGLVLFVYCVGVGAGVRFFAALQKQGQVLALLAAMVVGLGAALTWLLGRLLGVPEDLAVGIFAGALTSTPALAAATEILGEAAAPVSVGYGIAYPAGVIGIVLFVQLLPRLLRVNLEQEAAREGASEEDARIVSALVRVTNEELVGQRIADFEALHALECQITRVRVGDRMVPLAYDHVLEKGLEVLLVGRQKRLDTAVRLLGQRSPASYVVDTERERRQLLLTRTEFLRRPLRDLQLLRNHRIVISRVTRLGFTFIPTGDTLLERQDTLTVVGAPEDLERFAQAIGHRSQGFDETDLFSIGLGIAGGLLLGMLVLTLPGGDHLALGVVGGPLLAGLLLGHWGRIGPLRGFIPRPARLLLQELGLVLFLAESGIKGGEHLVATLQAHGLQLFGMGILVTAVPVLVAFTVARYLLRLPLLETLGGLCGGMTSTPALGAIAAKTDAQSPIVAYAAAYPVALIMKTLVVKLLL